MSCNCKLLERRVEKLQKKYLLLRKNHKKLLGVTVLLTDALDKFVKGEGTDEINETLLSCLKIYPDLFENTKTSNFEAETINFRNESDSAQIVNKDEKVCEPTTESEREYYEGFLTRSRIPRTPQV